MRAIILELMRRTTAMRQRNSSVLGFHLSKINMLATKIRRKAEKSDVPRAIRPDRADVAPAQRAQRATCRARVSDRRLRLLPVLDDELERRLAAPFVDVRAVGGADRGRQRVHMAGTGSRRSVRCHGRAPAWSGSRPRCAGRAPQRCRRRAGRGNPGPRLRCARCRRARSRALPVRASRPSRACARGRRRQLLAGDRLEDRGEPRQIRLRAMVKPAA